MLRQAHVHQRREPGQGHLAAPAHLHELHAAGLRKAAADKYVDDGRTCPQRLVDFGIQTTTLLLARHSVLDRFQYPLTLR